MSDYQGSFTCRKSTTWDRRLCFHSGGRRAEDFFDLKNPTASAGFEPANLGTKASRLPLDHRTRFLCGIKNKIPMQAISVVQVWYILGLNILSTGQKDKIFRDKYIANIFVLVRTSQKTLFDTYYYPCSV